MQPAVLNTTSVRGDRYDLRLPFVSDVDGQPLNLTGLTWACQLRLHADAAEYTDCTVDLTHASTGVILVTLAADDSALLGGVYVRDVQATDGANDPVTLITGIHRVTLDVSR